MSSDHSREIGSVDARTPAAVPSVVREAFIVARYEIIAMVVSVRALLLVVTYGVIAGGFGALYLWVDRQSGGKLEEIAKKTGELAAAEKEQIISQMADKIGRPLAEAILNGDLPPLVLFVLLLSTFVIPGLVLLVGYGSIAEDLHTRYARFLLQRVRRGSYLAGKIAAHFIVAYGAVIFVHVMLLLYATTISNFDTERTLVALPRIWLAMAFFVLGYVAYTAVFSAILSPPFLAFAIGGIALLSIWVLAFFPGIDKVWMGAWHMQLWALDVRAIGVYVAHAIVFIALSYVGLRRRDV